MGTRRARLVPPEEGYGLFSKMFQATGPTIRFAPWMNKRDPRNLKEILQKRIQTDSVMQSEFERGDWDLP